jgi:dolichyl-phosphate beta-glucosyltransferase
MDLSIIIPVYNEEKKISTDLREALSFCKNNNFKGEIIVVDDGSTDDTAIIVGHKKINPEYPVHLISYKPNRGKGYAVKQGILCSKGEIVMFIDSGNCVPYDNILPAIRLIHDGKAGIAHASRFLPESKILANRPFHRRFWSWSFRKFIKLYAKLPSHLTDSQCGLSVYNGDIARELYSECRSEGFMFDVEVIIRAVRKGYKIIEFPIQWTPDPDSRLKPAKLIGRIGGELKEIRKLLNS